MSTTAFVRTCQECGHHQAIAVAPKGEPTDAYREAACRRCKSPALDYGSEGWTKVDGKWESSKAQFESKDTPHEECADPSCSECHTVTITFRIAPGGYEGARNTAKGVLELVTAIIHNEADWPGPLTIACEGKTFIVEDA